MIWILGKAFYWPGERVLLDSLDLAGGKINDLEVQRTALERQLTGLTTMLQVARGDDFAIATGEGYQISPEFVLDYDERRTGGSGKLREITASVTFARLATDPDLYEARWVEFGGLRWKLVRAQPMAERHHGYAIGRRAPEILMGRQWVEVQLVAYAGGRG